MSVRCAIYVGAVMHRRLRPRRHHFRYRAFWLLLDLDELPELSDRFRWFSHNRANLFSLYDTDHGDGSGTPLRIQIERRVIEEAGINLSGGRIQLLCMPRTLGYCFNPLSIFFCHRAGGTLAAVVYQVHNTFAERHSYIIPVEEAGNALHQRCSKLFYVSPFMDMDLRYQFRVVEPDEHVQIGICASRDGTPVLNAVLTGVREPLTDRNLIRLWIRMPAITLKVIAAIHWEALRLWAKGIGFRRRPAPLKRSRKILNSTPAPWD
jgi:uncharacterized protein